MDCSSLLSTTLVDGLRRAHDYKLGALDESKDSCVERLCIPPLQGRNRDMFMIDLVIAVAAMRHLLLTAVHAASDSVPVGMENLELPCNLGNS